MHKVMRTRRWVTWCARFGFLIGFFLQSASFAQSVQRLDIVALRQEMSNQRATCVFFFVEDCPVSMRDFSIIRSLHQKYSGLQVKFVAAYVGLQPEKLGDLADSIALDITFIPDLDRALTNLTGARITPEYFLFDVRGKLRYRGAMDNYFIGLAKHRKRVSANYLDDAIVAVINGQKVPVTATKPIGCGIEPVAAAPE